MEPTENPEILPQRAEHPAFLTKTKFTDFVLPQEILAGIQEAGFTYCTPIQAEIIPIVLQGRDVAGQAQTGTGKTAAFLVPLMAKLLTSNEPKSDLPSALITAPTRELALQIYEDAKVIGRYTNLRMALVVGGIDYQKQAQILRQGTDIVICTPGRIIDYLKQRIFKTENIRVLVIDEADRLFDLGFTKDMRFILRRLPHYEKRLSMLFSATLSYRVLALTYDYMNLPDFIAISPAEVTVKNVEQTLYHVSTKEKLPLLLGLLEKEDWSRILIFANTKAGVEWLAAKLQGNGLPTEGITGDLPQLKRLKLMQQFKDGKLKILVATDVASRGIHVEDISHVINYDLPQDPENYPHRIGRTARAGKSGKAISLACENYVFHLEAIEAMLGEKIPVAWPQEDWFKEDKAGPVRVNQYKSKRGVPDRPQRREPRREPRPEQRSEQKPRPKSISTSSQKIISSTEPGGIFGLAPSHEPKPSHNTPEAPKSKKKRRPRRRRKKPGASDNQPAQQASEMFFRS